MAFCYARSADSAASLIRALDEDGYKAIRVFASPGSRYHKRQQSRNRKIMARWRVIHKAYVAVRRDISRRGEAAMLVRAFHTSTRLEDGILNDAIFALAKAIVAEQHGAPGEGR